MESMSDPAAPDPNSTEEQPDAPQGQDSALKPEPTTALQTVPDRSLALPDPLQRYMADVGRFPLLNPEEEKELAIRYREYGDSQAAYRMATHNLRLVVHIAMDFRRTAHNLLDLIQEGNIGLLQAVQKFDPYRKVRFSAYASWWIRAYMLKYLIDHWSLVRVGTTNTRRRLLWNLKKEKHALEAKGIKPEPEILAKRLGVSTQELMEVQQGMGRDLSIDEPVSEGGTSSYSDLMASPQPPADEVLADEEFQRALRDKLEAFGDTLDERNGDIFHSRLLSDTPATLQEIGESHGISREAVRQRERKIVQRLKEYLRQELVDFAGLDFLRADANPPDALSK
jgi:RNA polymerase sigma-32 factor